MERFLGVYEKPQNHGGPERPRKGTQRGGKKRWGDVPRDSSGQEAHKDPENYKRKYGKKEEASIQGHGKSRGLKGGKR